MNVLLVNVPSRKGEGGFMLPLGLLYAGAIIERCGHKAKIVDMYLTDVAELFKTIDDFKPAIIGFGGIATSYGGTKQLSLRIRDRYPNLLQIAGGALASTYELLLTRTKIDVVFHGETEASLPLFLERLVHGKPFHDVPGISYLLKGQVIRNEPPKQIENLDEISFPAYHLVDVGRYLQPVKDFLEAYSILIHSNPNCTDIIEKIGNKTHYIPIISARGCTHRCFFCYRHMFGHRQHSVKYVIEHIKYVQRTCGISGFQFADELFNRDPKWVMELCDAIEREKLDIFYIVGGARVDRIDEKMLRRLKQTGCIAIEYGQESGSDLILNEYRKGVTSEQNREITKLTRKVGLLSTVQLVIGSPSETNETIGETIQFLKDAYAYQFSLNYLIPLPETPSWQYVMERNLIKDVEKYLDDVAEYGGTRLLVNLTKEPNDVVKRWADKISYEVTKYYYWRTNRILYLLYSFVGKARMYVGPFIPGRVKDNVGKFLKQIRFKI
jgi:anaerobic magnesium-protoporphyrin IX monomethyl ester cyclase